MKINSKEFDEWWKEEGPHLESIGIERPPENHDGDLLLAAYGNEGQNINKEIVYYFGFYKWAIQENVYEQGMWRKIALRFIKVDREKREANE